MYAFMPDMRVYRNLRKLRTWDEVSAMCRQDHLPLMLAGRGDDEIGLWEDVPALASLLDHEPQRQGTACSCVRRCLVRVRTAGEAGWSQVTSGIPWLQQLHEGPSHLTSRIFSGRILLAAFAAANYRKPSRRVLTCFSMSSLALRTLLA